MCKCIGNELNILFSNYPELSILEESILAAFKLMRNCYLEGGLIMVCGNGGSAADACHIVGELMKGFKLKRALKEEQRLVLEKIFPDVGNKLADTLQEAIPAISLTGEISLSTAFINDITPDMVYAQQVFGYGKKGDVLIGLSTSGNSENIVNACKIAKAFNLRSIGMTGETGGKMAGICDVMIRVPASDTYRVQEYHLPVYHTLCAMLEIDLFN